MIKVVGLFIFLSLNCWAVRDRAGGGGNAGGSTPEQVNAAIDRVKTNRSRIRIDAPVC